MNDTDRMLTQNAQMRRALHAILTLGDQAEGHHKRPVAERRQLVDQLYDAVDKVADFLSVETAEAGERLQGDDLIDLSWAHDMIKRGEVKDAEELMRGILKRAKK